MWSCGAYDASFAVQRKQLIPLSIRVPLPLEPMHRCLLPSARAKSAAKCDSHEQLFAASIPSERILRKNDHTPLSWSRQRLLQDPGWLRTASFFRKQSRKSAFDCANHDQSGTPLRRLAPTRPATAHAQSYAPIVGRTGF